MTGAAGQPAVSVIIAAYNAEPFLERAVRSALAQTVPVEVVIIDDASTDGTLALARRLAAESPSVVVRALDRNGGPSAARNEGLTAASGAWIAVLDADDAFEPDHLAGLHAVAQAEAADVVLGNFIYFDPTTGISGQTGIPADGAPQHVDAAGYVARARPLASDSDWGLLKPMFRAAFLQAHRIRYPTFSRHGEDFLLMVETLLCGAVVVSAPAPTYRYTQRHVGWSRTRLDYESIIAQSRTLLDDSRVTANAALQRAIRERMDALTRWSAKVKVDWWLHSRRYLALGRGALTDANVRREIARRFGGRAQAAGGPAGAG